MRFPNKLYDLSDSIFADMIVILNALNKPCSLFSLYNATKMQISNVILFVDALDALYALKKIEYKGGLIYAC